MNNNQRYWRINQLIRTEVPLNEGEDEALELAYEITDTKLRERALMRIADAVTTPT